MHFLKTLTFFFALLKTSMKASVSLRGAFLFESSLMIANNLLFLFLWWVFFKQFKTIGEWTLKDMIALNAIGMGAYGVMLVFFGGVKTLYRIILTGNLDPFMTQPKNLLLHLLGSQSLSKGWGHLMTSVLLVFLGKFMSLSSILLIFVSTLCGGLVFTAIGIIAHSLVFWLGSVESLSRKYCDSLFLFALYPTNIYSGILQVIMFTILPAGIIGYLPVEILRNFSWVKLAILLASSLSFLVLAFLIFSLGLKKYESGNQFGMRL